MKGEQERKLLKQKAEAFERIVERYRKLQQNADFYSKNWVELSELIEKELRQLTPES